MAGTFSTVIWGITLALTPPKLLELERLPRLAGKADLHLWREVTNGNIVYSQTKRPLFALPKDPAALEQLKALGIDTELGRWTPLFLTNSDLVHVMSSVDGLEIRRARAHAPLLDRSLPEMQIDQVHEGLHLELSRKGNGVLVGIVDTGIDIHHAAFRKPNGSTRIIAVWDQDAPNQNSPEPFDYGYECKRRDIESGACTISDAIGHGTHVAGIAAGLKGVAPEADIAVVRSDTFTRIADAVLYLTNLADKRDQSLAINLSVGGQYGAHNGKTPLELYLSDLVGKGKIIAAAAGNYGADRIHVGAELKAEWSRVELDSLPQHKDIETLIELWSPGGTVSELALELWRDNRALVRVPLRVQDSEFLVGELRLDNTLLGEVSCGVELDSDSGKSVHSISYTSLNPLPDQVFVALALRGEGRVDGWLGHNDYRYGQARFGLARDSGWLSGDGEDSITVPATAKKIIAVGAYNTRSSWISDEGEAHQLSPLPEFGALALFSSMGAPRAEWVKPDLSAPGSLIASARSSLLPPGPNFVNGDDIVMQGTSMAAPHVTGVLALMLEAFPSLTPARARKFLQWTARHDEYTGTVPNTEWGYGKVDAMAAVQMAEQEAPGCSALGTPSLVFLALFWRLTKRRKRRM